MQTTSPPKDAREMTREEWKAARARIPLDAIIEDRNARGEQFMKRLRKKHGIAEPTQQEAE